MRNNGKQVSNLMLKYVFCFWSYKFDLIVSWWENKNYATISVGLTGLLCGKYLCTFLSCKQELEVHVKQQ